MRRWGLAAAAAVGVTIGGAMLGPSTVDQVDMEVLREYAGVYRWERSGSFVYLQPWSEILPEPQLVAFDESGELRALYPSDRDRFFTGASWGIDTPVESRVDFRRDGSGTITSLRWRRNGEERIAERADTEQQYAVRFSNADVELAGTLFTPTTGGPHPAVILVHGSGAATREQILPYARFLVRRGMAVLAFDKRGVGSSTGDWNTASFADLAGDVAAACAYLRTRGDIRDDQVGMLGLSQAGWIMPLAATRVAGVAFVISISGAGIPAAETMIDHARNEMTSNGMRPQAIDPILRLMRLQYDYLRTGEGWDQYRAQRERVASTMGADPPESFPAVQDHPHLRFLRPLLRHDPGPVLRQLRAPVLALFGELDNNIMAEKNRTAWELHLRAGLHPDYTLKVVPAANHAMLEATLGHNAEMPSLQRFVPAYFDIVLAWLSERVVGLSAR